MYHSGLCLFQTTSKRSFRVTMAAFPGSGLGFYTKLQVRYVLFMEMQLDYIGRRLPRKMIDNMRYMSL